MLLPGVVVGLALAPTGWTAPEHLLLNILLGFLSVCLVSSSNYVLNEVMDAPFDRLHPTKRDRPVVSGEVNITFAYAQWIGLMAAGIGLAFFVSVPFTLTMLAFWLSACAYNIPPVRAKDWPYLDVFTEAVTNPLRMVGGWFLVGATAFPPTSVLISYWLFGCFFMALKRFAEVRHIGAGDRAATYRRSFGHYTERRLLISTLIYSTFAVLFLGVFILYYRVELILSLPLVVAVMGRYMFLAFKLDSPIQHTERVYRDKPLVLAMVICAAVVSFLLFVDIPAIEQFLVPPVRGLQ